MTKYADWLTDWLLPSDRHSTSWLSDSLIARRLLATVITSSMSLRHSIDSIVNDLTEAVARRNGTIDIKSSQSPTIKLSPSTTPSSTSSGDGARRTASSLPPSTQHSPSSSAGGGPDMQTYNFFGAFEPHLLLAMNPHLTTTSSSDASRRTSSMTSTSAAAAAAWVENWRQLHRDLQQYQQQHLSSSSIGGTGGVGGEWLVHLSSNALSAIIIHGCMRLMIAAEIENETAPASVRRSTTPCLSVSLPSFFWARERRTAM